MTDTNNAATTAATPTFDFARWQEEERARSERLEGIRPQNKAALFAALASAGITTVTAVFDGYGDSGGIEYVHAERDRDEIDLPTEKIKLLTIPWRETEAIENDVTVFAAIEHMAYELLGETYRGWENNSGAYGEFVFDVQTQTIALGFNQRFEDSELFEHVF